MKAINLYNHGLYQLHKHLNVNTMHINTVSVMGYTHDMIYDLLQDILYDNVYNELDSAGFRKIYNLRL